MHCSLVNACVHSPRMACRRSEMRGRVPCGPLSPPNACPPSANHGPVCETCPRALSAPTATSCARCSGLPRCRQARQRRDPVAAAPRGPDVANSFAAAVPLLRRRPCAPRPCVRLAVGAARLSTTGQPVAATVLARYGDSVGPPRCRLRRPAAGYAAPLPVVPPRCRLRRSRQLAAVGGACAQSGGRRTYL